MKKSKRIVLYLDPEEYRAVKLYLASKGISCSEWVRKRFSAMARFIDKKRKND